MSKVIAGHLVFQSALFGWQVAWILRDLTWAHVGFVSCNAVYVVIAWVWLSKSTSKALGRSMTLPDSVTVRNAE